MEKVAECTRKIVACRDTSYLYVHILLEPLLILTDKSPNYIRICGTVFGVMNIRTIGKDTRISAQSNLSIVNTVSLIYSLVANIINKVSQKSFRGEKKCCFILRKIWI